MINNGSTTMGKHDLLIFGYSVFIKTSPMLLICLGYYADKKKLLYCVLVFIALILSGTRANAALALFIIMLSTFMLDMSKKKKIVLAMIIFSLIAYILWGQDMLLRYMALTEYKSEGDTVRADTIVSIIESWKKNPISFFIGQGYTSTFFNLGRMSYASEVEVSYWNLLRRVGLFCFVLMLYCYIKPLHKLFVTNKKIIAISYLAYLIGCYVNPLLYTSSGVTVMLFAYVFAYNDFSKKNLNTMIYCPKGHDNNRIF